MSQELNDYFRYNRTPSTNTFSPDIPQYSAGDQFRASASRGVNDSLITGLLPDTLAMASARSNDEASGLKPLTEEEFNARGYNYYGEMFKYKPKETPSQTQLRFNRFTRQYIQNIETSNNDGFGQVAANFVTEFGAGMAGDLPIAFIPYANVANTASKASNALRVGWRTASQQAIAKQSARQTAYMEAFESGSIKLPSLC